MSLEELQVLIDSIPQYICYIYPGYITLYLYFYFHSLTLDETKAKVIKSIIISYIYIILDKAIIGLLNKFLPTELNANINGIAFNALLILASVLIPYIIYLIETKSSFFEKAKSRLSIKTSFSKNEIEVLQKKYSDTIWIYVYMRDGNIMYEGSLTEKELELGRTQFFCLSKYRKYIINSKGKKAKLADYSNDDKEKVLIYFDRISHFEIANVDKSE